MNRKKPTVKPVVIQHIDLNRSQPQSPFALGQFQHPAFSRLSLDTKSRVPTPPTENTTESTSSTEMLATIFEVTQPGDEDTRTQGLDGVLMAEIANSPVEMDHLYNTDNCRASTPTASLDTTSHDSQSSTPSSPMPSSTRTPTRSLSRTSSFGTSTSPPPSLLQNILSFLPIILAVSALTFDIPVFSVLSSSSSKSPLMLTSHLDMHLVPRDSSVVLSYTLCGMLLFWLCGCAILVLAACVVLGVVASSGDTGMEKEKKRKATRWKLL